MSEANMVEQKWLECLHFEFIQHRGCFVKKGLQRHRPAAQLLCSEALFSHTQHRFSHVPIKLFLHWKIKQNSTGLSRKNFIDVFCSLTCILTERHNAVYICKHISHKYVQAGISHCKNYDIKYLFCLTGNKFFKQ